METSNMLTGKSMGFGVPPIWSQLFPCQEENTLPIYLEMMCWQEGFTDSRWGLGKRKLVNNNLSVLLYHDGRTMELCPPWLVVFNVSFVEQVTEENQLPWSKGCVPYKQPALSVLILHPTICPYSYNPISWVDCFRASCIHNQLQFSNKAFFLLYCFPYWRLSKFSKVHEFFRVIFKCCAFIWKVIYIF